MYARGNEGVVIFVVDARRGDCTGDAGALANQGMMTVAIATVNSNRREEAKRT
jgi:hypothetical protein